VPRLADKKKAVEIMRQIEEKISSYLLTTTLINVGLGAALCVVLWAIGMPNPLLWGLLATLLNYIPYIGALTGIAILFMASILSFDHLGYALIAPSAYIVINTIEGSFVAPMILGRSLELNPVAIFISLLFWGWLWGISGALLAVPLLVALKIVSDRVAALAPVSVFLAR
jgi:predicted PurR-regulated permease PerM